MLDIRPHYDVQLAEVLDITPHYTTLDHLEFPQLLDHLQFPRTDERKLIVIIPPHLDAVPRLLVESV